jgi:hypothetical protein
MSQHLDSYIDSEESYMDSAGLFLTFQQDTIQPPSNLTNIQWLEPMITDRYQGLETWSSSIQSGAFESAHISTSSNPPLQSWSRNGHVSYFPYPGSLVESRGDGFATTPAAAHQYTSSIEPSSECNFKFMMEDPSDSNSYSEKLIQTKEERAQQKEDGRLLKTEGGACISCYKSKKKCGLGSPCPLCKRSGKECVRRYPGSSESSSSSSQPSTPELGEDDSHPKLPRKDNPAGFLQVGFPIPQDNKPNPDSSISAQCKQWGPLNDTGRDSPLVAGFDAALEQEDLNTLFPGIAQLWRATYR